MLNKSALNVIHSNCTNSRPDGHRVYGDCICSINPQKYRISAKSGNSKPCYCHLLKNRYEKQTSNCAGFKNCMVKWLLSKCTMCSSKGWKNAVGKWQHWSYGQKGSVPLESPQETVSNLCKRPVTRFAKRIFDKIEISRNISLIRFHCMVGKTTKRNHFFVTF